MYVRLNNSVPQTLLLKYGLSIIVQCCSVLKMDRVWYSHIYAEMGR